MILNNIINNPVTEKLITISSTEKLLAKARSIWNYSLANPKKVLFTILVIISIISVFVLVLSFIDQIIELTHNRRLERTSVLMEILPKETTKIKDTEALIRNIHALLLNTKMRKLMFGRPYMSFEIGASMDKIKFYIRIPKEYKEMIRERIYSTYTEVAIREATEDYLPEKVWFTFRDLIKNIKGWIKYILKKSSIKPKELINHLQLYGTEMELGYHHVLSIKTNQEKDLLSSLLAGMKNLEWHQTISVQIQVRPLDNTWQLRGRKIIENFERDGKRPVRGNDFTNFFSSFGEALTDGLDEELEKQGLSAFKSKAKRKTRLERKEISVATDKLLEAGFETIIRVLAVGHYGKDNKSRIKGITAAFNELDRENRFKRDIIYAKKLFYNRAKARRMYLFDRKNILTTSELSSFFLRLPGPDIINDFQDIEALVIKEFAPPKDVETKENIFAKNYYRGKETFIGIKNEDLVRHCILQGITGTGKSEFIKSLMLEFARSGKGLVLIEPHGKLANEFLELIPEERKKDVIYFDLFDSHPPAFNFCKVFKREGVSMEDAIEKTSDSVTEIFKSKFSEAWSSKNEYYVENGIKTVIELQEGNILDIQKLFTDTEFRKYAISKIKDPQVKQFWKTEFAEDKNGNLSMQTQSTVLSVMYKLGKFLNSKKMLRSIAQQDSIDFKEALDQNKIIIFKFSKEDMSEDRINFLGSIAIKLLVDAGFTRKKEMRKVPYLMVIDEAQNFISPSILTILDELRKFGLTLFLMHQRKDQLNKVEGLADALYNNVGTMMTFTVGQPDAPYFEKIYGPRVDQMDLRRLPSRYGYCQLLVDGHRSETFNIYSLDRPEVDLATAKQTVFDIKKLNRDSRMHFKEIDAMLAKKINHYKKLDENGVENAVDSEEFVEDYSDEYQQIEIVKGIKNVTNISDDNNEEYEQWDQRNQSEQQNAGHPPIDDFNYYYYEGDVTYPEELVPEDCEDEEFNFESELKNIPIYLAKQEIENEMDTPTIILNKNQSALDKKEVKKLNIDEYEEFNFESELKNIPIYLAKQEIENEMDTQTVISSKNQPVLDKKEVKKLNIDEDRVIVNEKKEEKVINKKKMTLKDLFGDSVENIESEYVEEIKPEFKIIEKESKIEFTDECLGLNEYIDEEAELEELKNMWTTQKEKESIVINKSKVEDTGEIQGKNLWSMAKDKEKKRSGK